MLHLSLCPMEMAWWELATIFQNHVFLTLMYPTNKDSIDLDSLGT